MCYQGLMQEPSPRKSRLAIAGGVVAVLAVGFGGFVLGRETMAVAPPPPPAAPVEALAPVQPAPPLPTMLVRRDILELARSAADAAASQQPLAQSVVDAAVHRRFTLYLPFGCAGPQPDDTAGMRDGLRWQYDAKKGVLRLHVAPQVWQAGQWWSGADVPELDAIEGFWISRPWSSSETCVANVPAAAPAMQPAEIAASTEPQAKDAASKPAKPGKPVKAEDEAAIASQVAAVALSPAPAPTLAIAQFFPPDASRRALRRGAPFESVIRLPPEKFRHSAGFRVKLTGRIEQVPNGGPVRCIQREGTDQRPTCIVAASIEEVVIENPATGETLATWTL